MDLEATGLGSSVEKSVVFYFVVCGVSCLLCIGIVVENLQGLAIPGNSLASSPRAYWTLGEYLAGCASQGSSWKDSIDSFLESLL